MEQVESALTLRLQQDKELDKDKAKKMAFLSCARSYDTDLGNNLKLTSLELDAKYKTASPSLWQQFVMYPVVKHYIDGYLEEIQEKKAAILLSEDAGHTRDALSITKEIYERRKGKDNSQFIVLWVPQRKYIKE